MGGQVRHATQELSMVPRELVRRENALVIRGQFREAGAFDGFREMLEGLLDHRQHVLCLIELRLNFLRLDDSEGAMDALGEQVAKAVKVLHKKVEGLGARRVRIVYQLVGVRELTRFPQGGRVFSLELLNDVFILLIRLVEIKILSGSALNKAD